MLFKKRASGFEYLVVGLGNPGMQYEKTRHNAGFMAADLLAEKYDCTLSRNKFDAIYGDTEIGGHRVIIAKPQTYMNLSGKAVVAISQFYKIPLSNIIVMFDDISLDVGKIRIRRKGSAGGHNGIKDIIELTGTEDIMRIKIGVGAKAHPDSDLKDHVLGRIPDEQLKDFEVSLKNAVSAVGEILSRGVDSAMNKYSK
ncbi:MAG: aminoacyl-tRNA hydrolase [Clostridia bacterium]|nr:aminoacyl-tRNA hydrolase [Clostridia bacterium]MBQ2316263.1 aminoacyl-tRNA hydrolase [Clostridia bacterium]MEE0808195.1 aminoacyl-tRNA hydrolase [Acutalibacteraceae bacterium]